jgi:hypothetical protein
METLTETCAEVNYNQKLNAVVIGWKDFATTEQYKKVIENAALVIKEKNCKVWISDSVKGKAVPKEALEWLKIDFIPRLPSLGIKKAAFLVTGNAFRKLYADSIKTEIAKTGVQMKYFESRVELEKWITS